MGVNGHAKKRISEEGQSVLEFLLMLPMLVGITMMLVRVNTAIQMSIVNQQYARSQALWLAFNSSVYPEIKQRSGNFIPWGYNQMVIGISDKAIPPNGVTTPNASIENIARTARSPAGSDDPKEEPATARTKVRVRTTVTLCTQNNVTGAKNTPVLTYDKNFNASSPFGLNEGTQMSFCGGPYNE